MIGDLATCEWSPGQARSMVSIERAAERIPAADRAELVRQFNSRPRKPVDRVVIKREAIESETGFARYSPLMANMNFSRGRICETVTRAKWKDNDRQGAIVFKVNGQFYGYAAVCGNLFQLYGEVLPPKPPAPPAAGAPPPGMTITSVERPAELVLPPVFPLPLDDAPSGGEPPFVGSTPWYPGGGVFIGGGGGAPHVDGHVASIPEPSFLALMAAGLAAIILRRRR